MKPPAFNIRDDSGNLLYTEAEDIGRGNAVYLKLMSEKRRRKLGRVVVGEKTGRIIFAKTIEDKHIMQVNRSIGFCDDVLRQLPATNSVLVVHWAAKTLYLSLDEARRVGSYLHFKGQGFERQFFVPLANFKLKEG